VVATEPTFTLEVIYADSSHRAPGVVVWVQTCDDIRLGDIDSTVVDWGDGSPSQRFGWHPIGWCWSSYLTQHQYVCPGSYPITVTNYYGDSYRTCSTSASTTATLECDLVAAFSIARIPPEDPGSPQVRFTDQSTGTIVSRLWTFGDGESSTDQSPTHGYREWCTCDYEVSLTVTGGDSCTDVSTAVVSVASPLSCTAPKALVVSASVDQGTEDWYGFMRDVVTENLEALGWTTVPLPDPTLEELREELEDPCVVGLFIQGHGWEWRTERDSRILLRDGWASPEALGAATGQRRFEFISVSACAQYESDWLQGFNVRWSHLILPPFTVGPFRSSNLFDAWYAAVSPRHHFSNLPPCPGCAVQQRSAMTEGQRSVGTTGDCPSLLLCDEEHCGEVLYPVLGCAHALGVAEEGRMRVEAPNGVFEVDFRFPGDYVDSAGVHATCFQELPEELPGTLGRPIGRHLWYGDVAWGDSVRADSVTVMMRYLDTEVDTIGAEGSLAVFWLGADSSSAIVVPAVWDTLQNEVRFCTPGRGIAGLYALAGCLVGQEQPGLPPVLALRCQPNPMRRAMQINLALPRSMRVTLAIYDVSGRLVRSLLKDVEAAAGERASSWDARDDSGQYVAPGIYYCRLVAGSSQLWRKLAVVK
jgi:PKD repeat protein